MNKLNKKFTIAISSIFLFEVFSLFGYFFSQFNSVVFVFLVAFVFVVSLKKIEYGLWFSFVELIIGSKGYLFFITIFSFDISIRIGIWLALMLAFSIKMLILFYKNYLPSIINKKNSFFVILKNYLVDKKFLRYYLFLFGFVLISLLVSFINKNDLKNIFFDFNSWIFLSYVFPIYFAFYHQENKVKDLLLISLAAISWVSIKTFFLLYIFSHNIISIVPTIYLWIRKTGVGEITKMDSGFVRIFFQSHVYFLPIFFVFLISLIYLLKNKINLKNKHIYLLFFSSAVLLSVNLITFSRSNWVGLAFGSFVLLAFIAYREKIKGALLTLSILFLLSIASLIIITAVVKFPFPSPSSNFNPSSLISERATQISGEAGVSSRWALLTPLLNEIKKSPIVGSGFGKTVTYISSDPRVLESNPDGNYETFAFEWGWLDLWLKLGIFGVGFYLYFIYKIAAYPFKAKKEFPTYFDNNFYISLSLGLLVITIVNFFSPYLNHPIGFGYIMLVSIIFENK